MRFIVCTVFALGLQFSAGSLVAQEIAQRGTVKKLDLKLGTIAVQIGVDAPPKVFNLAGKNIPVVGSTGRKGSLAELGPGAIVTLYLAPTGDVTRIQARAPRGYGWINAVNAKERQLTLTSLTGKKIRTMNVAKDAKFTLHYTNVNLQTLDTGTFIYYDLSFDKSSIVGGRITYRRKANDPRGAIVGVDVENRKVTLLSGGETQPLVKTFPVAAKCKLIFNGVISDLDLANLPEAATYDKLIRVPSIWASLNRDGEIQAVLANSRRLQGVLKVVDRENKTFTATLENGMDAAFSLEKNADVRINGRTSKLANLAPGMRVDMFLSMNPEKAMRVYVRRR